MAKKIQFPVPADTAAAFDNDANATVFIYWWLAVGSNYNTGTLRTTWTNNVSADFAAGLNVNLADSTDNEWYITGIQWEEGDVATPFEHEDIGTTLAKCQRYLYRLETEQTSGAFVNLTGWNTNDTYGPILYPVEMRAAPTLSYGEVVGDFLILSAGTNPNPTELYSNGSSKRMMELRMSSTGNIVAGRSYWGRISDATNGYIQWDAEL